MNTQQAENINKTAPLLRVNNVHKRFGQTIAVKDISFEVFPGEVVCVLGPNGAGKTTTIEMCEGFSAPTSGSIEVMGINPSAQPDVAREKLGIMLQGGGSYSSISVKNMLELAASYNADPHDPQWLMELLGLQSVSTTSYRRLSGGQQQRLSLALAIIGRPHLVFLDEPTAGMDAQSRHIVWDIIRALQRDGVAVVLTTHFLDEAQSLADRILIVDHGEVITQGSPDSIIEKFQADFPQACAPVLTTYSAISLDSLPPHMKGITSIGENTYRLDHRADPEFLAELLKELAQQQVTIKSFSNSPVTIEDVFLELTGSTLRP